MRRLARNTRRRRRVRLSLGGLRDENPVISVNKSWSRLNERASKGRRIVYFILGDRSYRYPRRRILGGHSKILYIGMTEKSNVKRPFTTLREKAESLFKKVHGLKRLEVRCISALGRQRVSVADELESACLDTFDEMFGDKPLANGRGKAADDKVLARAYRLFPRETVRRLLVSI